MKKELEFKAGQKVWVTNYYDPNYRELVTVRRTHMMERKHPTISYQNSLGQYCWAHFRFVEAFDA